MKRKYFLIALFGIYVSFFIISCQTTSLLEMTSNNTSYNINKSETHNLKERSDWMQNFVEWEENREAKEGGINIYFLDENHPPRTMTELKTIGNLTRDETKKNADTSGIR